MHNLAEKGGDMNNEILMQHLQVLQNNAARTILDLPKYFSGTEALVKLGWTPFACRRRFHRCVAIYKYLNNLISSDLSLIRNSAIHSYNTHRCHDLHLPRAHQLGQTSLCLPCS